MPDSLSELEAGRSRILRQFGTLGDLRSGSICGANSIIALRCCHLNGRFEDYWETRRAA
jgi:hypothetical protein